MVDWLYINSLAFEEDILSITAIRNSVQLRYIIQHVRWLVILDEWVEQDIDHDRSDKGVDNTIMDVTPFYLCCCHF